MTQAVEEGGAAGAAAGARGPGLALRRLLVFLAGALAFATALPNRFVNMDDPAIILEQPFLRAFTARNLWTCLWPFPAREEYLPLRDLTYMANFALHGEWPAGFALGNLLLHGAAALAVYALLRRLFVPAAGALGDLPPVGAGSGNGPGRGPGGEVLALAGALLFALHPIHTESVAWLSGRKDPLSGALYVLAVCAYLDYLRAPRGRRLGPYVAAGALAGAALLSKASAVSIPGVLLAADLLLVRRRPLLARLAAVAPFALAAVAYARGYTALLARYGEASAEFPLKRHPEDALRAVLYTDASVIQQYAGRLLVPLDLRLFPYQDYRTALTAEVALGLAVLVVLAAGTAYLCRRRPTLGFLAAWSWLTLVPALNLAPSGILYAERYLYLPSVGVCGLFAVGLGALAGRVGARLATRPGQPPPAARVLGLLLAPLLGLYMAQCLRMARVFRDGETLWTYVLAREPRHTIALGNLANWQLDRDPARAEALYRRAIEVDPGQATARYSLGRLLEREGRLDEALASYREAERTRPGYRKAVEGAATVLARQGRWREAVALYDELLRRWPRVGARSAFNRALVLDEAGEDLAARAAWVNYLTRYGGRAEEAPYAAAARARLGGD